jgi:hypothetical protein
LRLRLTLSACSAQQTVRQRWQIYQETATRRAGDFPADARKDHGWS